MAHAGSSCQCLLQGLALLQCGWWRRACRPLTGQQVPENVAVAPQCTVDQCALSFLIQVVHLEGRGREGQFSFTFPLRIQFVPQMLSANPIPLHIHVPVHLSGELCLNYFMVMYALFQASGSLCVTSYHRIPSSFPVSIQQTTGNSEFSGDYV